MRLSHLLVLAAASALGAVAAQAADYDGPYHHRVYGRHHGPRASIGECVRTRVEAIGPWTSASSMPVIRYQDRVIQEYDSGMLGHLETRVGDPIQLCLVAFTRECDNGDDLPGRTYATGNLRTGAAWTEPDVRSSCTVK